MKKILPFFLLFVSQFAISQIYQCGKTLTDRPCSDHKLLTSKSVSSSGNQVSESFIYECKKPNEARFLYQTDQCSDGYLQVARHVVPSGLSFKDKVYIIEMREQGRRVLDSRKASAGVIPSPVTRQHSPECKSISDQIKHIDDLMRNPQSAANMSHLTAQRRELSDRRFRECR